MLSGHTDVVPVDGQDWSTDPFVMTANAGALYGRGTADMKGFIACTLARIPQMMEKPLLAPVHLALSYDEEIGCIGVRRLLDVLSDHPVKPAMGIIGEPTMMKVINAHKGKHSWRVSIRGRAAHSAYPVEGVKARVCREDLGLELNLVFADLEFPFPVV